MEALILQFVPLVIVQAVYALVVFLMARKQRTNTLAWTLGTVVPFFGMFVALVFFVRTQLSVLDRLNALEGKATFS
jgi:hypothetical protein